MTVGHVYPSDHLVLFPDVLSKRVARGSCSRAGGQRTYHHSWGSGALLRPSPLSPWSWQALQSALLFKNVDIYVYVASGNPYYHSSASWGSPHLVCVSDNEVFPLQKVRFTDLSFRTRYNYQKKSKEVQGCVDTLWSIIHIDTGTNQHPEQNHELLELLATLQCNPTLTI